MRLSRGVRVACLAGLALAVAGGALAAEPPKLRYGFQVGRTYGYEVKIVADTDHSEETREGVISYTAASGTDSQVVLKQSGTLASRSKPKAGRSIASVRFPGWLRVIESSRTRLNDSEGTTLDRQGTMLVSHERSHLPFLLGDLELLVIEQLPVEAKAHWEKQRDVVVQDRGAPSFPSPVIVLPGADGAVQRAAREQFEYRAAGVQGTTVRVAKKYSLRSLEEISGTPRLDMSGQGEFSFDAQQGVISAMSMKYEIRVNEPNLTLKIPVALTYRLLPPAEYQKRTEQAKAKTAAEAAKRAAELARRNAPKFEPGERERLLAELQEADPGRVRAAVERLTKVPADAGAAQFAKALVPLLEHADDWIKGAAAKALETWATPEAEEALIKASASESFWVRTPAILALGRLKTAKAADAVAAQMYRNRGEAGKALKAMGPVAEAAAIGCLKDRDGWVRGEAAQVLAEIGGEPALKALKEYAAQSKGFDVRHAEQAILAIQARLAKGGQAKPRAAPRAAKPELRTWRHAGGAFEVEATMVGVEDGKVRLKRKDGRTVAVPIEQLSEVDQAFIKRHGK